MDYSTDTETPQDTPGLTKEKNNVKHILKDATGYAKPSQILAIMGPSGCGKTSLLNVLASRLDLSRNSKCTGQVLCNGTALTESEFGKIAAFV